jgi:hypothetical protein
VSVLLLSQAGGVFRKRILHRDLLILQRLNGSVFDALNALNAPEPSRSRQRCRTPERLHTHYPALIGGDGYSLKSSQGSLWPLYFITVPTSLPVTLIKVSDEGVSQAVTCPAIRLPNFFRLSHNLSAYVITCRPLTTLAEYKRPTFRRASSSAGTLMDCVKCLSILVVMAAESFSLRHLGWITVDSSQSCVYAFCISYPTAWT